jgi:hypothetical protein
VESIDGANVGSIELEGLMEEGLSDTPALGASDGTNVGSTELEGLIARLSGTVGASVGASVGAGVGHTRGDSCRSYFSFVHPNLGLLPSGISSA